MSTLFLVACVSKKVEGPALAKNLYSSPWFRKARCYVEKTGLPWFILSAKHGLVHPDKQLDCYNQLLSNKKEERRQWVERIFKELEPNLRGITRVVLLAGKRYREHLEEKLEQKAITVCKPMCGKRIGEQLKWLNEQLA